MFSVCTRFFRAHTDIYSHTCNCLRSWTPGNVARLRLPRTPAAHCRSAKVDILRHTFTHLRTKHTHKHHRSVVSESVRESHSCYAASGFYNSRQHGTFFFFYIQNNYRLCLHSYWDVLMQVQKNGLIELPDPEWAVIWRKCIHPCLFSPFTFAQTKRASHTHNWGWLQMSQRKRRESLLSVLCVGQVLASFCTISDTIYKADLWICLL